jgi:hypothetical protein
VVPPSDQDGCTAVKQQWTIEEISIFSNSSHLEWRAGLSDTLLKGTHPGTIPARFGLIWFCGFRGEDLNVIFYQNDPVVFAISPDRLSSKLFCQPLPLRIDKSRFSVNST